MNETVTIKMCILFTIAAIVLLLVTAFPAHAGMIVIGAEAGGAASGTWEEIWTQPTSTSVYNNSDPWNERNVLTSAQVGGTGPWTKVRVTFARSSGTSSDCAASICIQDTGSTCTDTPTQLEFSGSSTFTYADDALSDEMDFSFDTDDAIMLHFYVPDGYADYSYQSGYTQYYEDGGGSNDTLETSLSGYSSDANLLGVIKKVEGWNPD